MAQEWSKSCTVAETLQDQHGCVMFLKSFIRTAQRGRKYFVTDVPKETYFNELLTSVMPRCTKLAVADATDENVPAERALRRHFCSDGDDKSAVLHFYGERTEVSCL